MPTSEPPVSPVADAAPAEAVRTPASNVVKFQDNVRRHIRYTMGKDWEDSNPHDLFRAVAGVIRDRLVDGMLETEHRYQNAGVKRLYYLSMEFLMGRSLSNSMCNLGLTDLCRAALAGMERDLDSALEQERDAALGNGGLGRLAACFLDSLATLDMPGFGYGINYEFGLFRQEIENGYQREKPDSWLASGTPWLVPHPSDQYMIPLYGRIEHGIDRTGAYNPMWMDWKVLIGIPNDMPIVGYGGRTVNFLRLFSAQSSEEFDMSIFNAGDYLKAVQQKISSETVSKVLYPSDSVLQGRELRLVQEYFLVACAVRDIFRRYLKTHTDFQQFPSQVAIQLNDTHPALTVAELMRMLLDENDVEWDEAWEITRSVLGYTNHTLMPEALEKWSVTLLEFVLPRHLQIIYEINRRFLAEAAIKRPGDAGYQTRLSIIEEGDEKKIRMAHLAIVGSHSVNGVSALHSELIKTDLVPDFYDFDPSRFNNKTNGVTPRRWLMNANPLLAGLITDTIGPDWVTDLSKVKELESYVDDPSFANRFLSVKRYNKERLSKYIADTLHVRVNPDSVFDVHVKRFHEYKRQLLNVLHIVYQYLEIVEDGVTLSTPKTYIFAGKAAPGYWAAKQIIKLITSISTVVNSDKRLADQLRVIFLPDYRVTLAEIIIPAADISEQISKAGTEASGTGNMKFQMNGALTIGTLDGANIEIFQEVGPENIYIFGKRADEIHQMTSRGSYRPADYLGNPKVARTLEAIRDGRFNPREPKLFGWIYESLVNNGDFYYHLADLPSYIECQRQSSDDYTRPADWSKKAILNVARSGFFSSDRTIKEYAGEIWGIEPI